MIIPLIEKERNRCDEIELRIVECILFVSSLLLGLFSVVALALEDDADERLRRFNFLIKTPRIRMINKEKILSKYSYVVLLLTRRNSIFSCSTFCRLSCSLFSSFRKSTRMENTNR